MICLVAIVKNLIDGFVYHDFFKIFRKIIFPMFIFFYKSIKIKWIVSLSDLKKLIIILCIFKKPEKIMGETVHFNNQLLNKNESFL